MKQAELLPPQYDASDTDGKAMAGWFNYGALAYRIHRAIAAGDTGAISFWEPARLIRGVLEAKIGNPGEMQDPTSVISAATEVALRIHEGTSTLDHFRAFELAVAAHPGLKQDIFYQPRDEITAAASDPALSEVTARKLRRYIDADDALFIILGHGGLTSGILAYLRYVNCKGRKGSAQDSTIYPVRFSREKSGDAAPQLSPPEVGWLQTLACERSRIVILDEDVSSGATITQAVDFFNRLLDVEAVPVANSIGWSVVNGPAVGMRAIKRLAGE